MEENKNEQDENEQSKKPVLFGGKGIRRTWHNNKWWFSVADVIQALTACTDPSDYLKKLRKRDEALAEGWGQIVTPLEVETAGGKQKANCANIKGIFRIIQMVHSRKAGPFKMWLAEVGEDRLQEIEDPEVGQARIRELYRKKGYSDEWIGKRMRGMEIRQDLTNEWQNRGMQTKKDYAILTNEISHATFGKTVEEYKQHKSLKMKDNLRDHMDEMELIFTMLGEKVTTKITQKDDAQGLDECKTAAKKGGGVAGRARRDAEEQIGEPIISNENYLDMPEKEKRKLLVKKKRKPTITLT